MFRGRRRILITIPGQRHCHSQCVEAPRVEEPKTLRIIETPNITDGCHQSLGCAICQTVICRQLSFSGCRPPDLEFFTEARRHGSNTPVLQGTLENVLTAAIVLTSTLVVLELTSVT